MKDGNNFKAKISVDVKFLTGDMVTLVLSKTTNSLVATMLN